MTISLLGSWVTLLVVVVISFLLLLGGGLVLWACRRKLRRRKAHDMRPLDAEAFTSSEDDDIMLMPGEDDPLPAGAEL